jgi:outer membrane immunogenic protein
MVPTKVQCRSFKSTELEFEPMKAFLLTMTAAAAFAAALPAHAADLGAPVPEVPMEAPTLPVPAPTVERVAPRVSGLIDWSGAYVGFQLGGAFNGKLDVGSDSVSRRLLSNGRDYSGFIGGGHIGFDYQVGSLVFGGIGDINYVNLRGRSAGPLSYTANGSVNDYLATGTAGLDVEGTVRARLGFAGLDLPVLPYVTGGLAIGQGSANYRLVGTTTDAAGVSTASNTNLKDTRTNVGYAVGGGFDYAFTDNIRGRVEYLYHDLSQTRYFKDISGGVDAGGSYSTVTGGVSYRW